MFRYRKICPRMWNDARVRELSDRAQLLFVFLLTHPHMTPVGAMRATLAGLAEERRWDMETLHQAVAELVAQKMVRHDPAAHYLELPNFVRYNPPENPNVLLSWGACLLDVPECASRSALVRRLMESISARGESWRVMAQRVMDHYLDSGTPLQDEAPEDGVLPGRATARQTRRRRKMAAEEPLTARMRETAQQHGVCGGAVETEWAKCRDYHLSRGTLLADVEACWRTWLRKREEFQVKKGGAIARAARASALLEGGTDDTGGVCENI